MFLDENRKEDTDFFSVECSVSLCINLRVWENLVSHGDEYA